MKIVDIFAPQLYAFHYDGEADDEFNRLMDLWEDASFLYSYAKQNKIAKIQEFVENISDNLEKYQDYIDEICENKEPFSCLFVPLDKSEEHAKNLSFQKGKIYYNRLRFYAIKIDDDCYVITGGAIKMSQKMCEHPDTDIELKKLNDARDYLVQNGVFDEASLYELIQEIEN